MTERAEVAQYLRSKARNARGSFVRGKATEGEANFASRCLEAAADEIAQGFHIGETD